MSEQNPENTGNTAQDPPGDKPGSPLRGTLTDNAGDGRLHDMGGNIGPADDTSQRGPDRGRDAEDSSS